MAFRLDVSLRKGQLVPPHKSLSETSILEPVPKSEMIVKDILARARSLGLGRVTQRIVGRPYTLGCLQIRETDTRYEVERVHLMISGSMHGFMEFRNRGYKSRRGSEVNISGPVVRHPMEEVDEPLTSDVVADEDKGKGCTPNGGAENIVHVRIPVQRLGIQLLLYR
jgi:hypothetical protein